MSTVRDATADATAEATAEALAAAATEAPQYTVLRANNKALNLGLLLPGARWDSSPLCMKQVAEILLTTKMFAPPGGAAFPLSPNFISETEFSKKILIHYNLCHLLDNLPGDDALGFRTAFEESPHVHDFYPENIRNPKIAAALRDRVLEPDFQEYCRSLGREFNSVWLGYMNCLLARQSVSNQDKLRADNDRLQKEVDAVKGELEAERAARHAECERKTQLQAAVDKFLDHMAAAAADVRT